MTAGLKIKVAKTMYDHMRDSAWWFPEDGDVPEWSNADKNKRHQLESLVPYILEAVFEWRPMSDAPHDKKIILLLNFGEDDIESASGNYSSDMGGWIVGADNYLVKEPIGWLPFPPKDREEIIYL